MNKITEKADKQKIAVELWASSLHTDSIFAVQYSGPEMVFTFPIPIQDIGDQVHGLICEGFHIQWNIIEDEPLLCIWEYPGPKPEWPEVKNRNHLVEIPEQFRRDVL